MSRRFAWLLCFSLIPGAASAQETSRDTPTLKIPEVPSFSARLPLRSVYGALHLAPDGSSLYALDLSEGQVIRVDPGTLEVTARLDVPADAMAMSMTPDGKSLYVGGRIPRDVLDMAGGKKRPGRLYVIRTKDFTISQTLEIDAPLFDLAATDRGIIAVSTAIQGSPVLLIDIEKQTELSVPVPERLSALRVSRDQKRVYVGSFRTEPSVFRILDRTESDAPPFLHQARYVEESAVGGPFEVSRDGQFLISSGGAVLRLGEGKGKEFEHVARIDPFRVAALTPSSDTFLTFTSEGYIKLYTVGSFKTHQSVFLGFRCEMAVLDGKERRVFGVFGNINDRHPYRLPGWLACIRLGAP